MKNNFICILLFLITCGCGKVKIAVNGQKDYTPYLTEPQSKYIFAESKDFPNNTQLALAMIKDGKAQFYGIKRENDTIISLDNRESVFEIGSISKVFTATLLADLVVKQRLNLDDNIDNYLNWPLKDDVKITFKQLSNHTSGLPRLPSNLLPDSVDLQNPYKDYDERKLKQYMSEDLELHQNPGEKFEYSNLGVGLLGFILSEIDSTSYEDLLQAKICTQYYMDHTTTDRKKIADKLVIGLGPNGNVTPNWDLNVLVGAGGIVSSVSDLSKFALAQFNNSNQVLALTRKSTFTTQENKSGIGLGWAIKTDLGKKSFSHSGGTGGYRSFLIIDIENKNGVIILSNISAAHKNSMNIDNLGTRLIESLKNTE
ncbi:serine hydrolase domain-containing protein [Arenibacter sp. F20364]|uniref:serine hydrolase domain-containing protein n=1 Tax=Arenibacter sp. F20364 TaxID=2926415 RepID=UPI001FF6C62B|nr:serine hydrolase domain-containing protein [Arenibacter sp. F20364]MCK0188730.1 beta-lactamase family protein [Arenibacter sp. F20364]